MRFRSRDARTIVAIGGDYEMQPVTASNEHQATARTTPGAARERRVEAVVPPWTWLGGVQWRSVLAVSLGIAVVLIDSAIAGRRGVGVAGVQMCIASVIIVVSIHVRRRQFAKEATARQAEGDAWGAWIARAVAEAAPFAPLKRVEARWQQLLALDPPRTIADARLGPALDAIPVRSELLEPEPIDQSSRGTFGIATFFVGLALVMSFDPGASRWSSLFLWATAGLLLLRTPKIRDVIPGMRASGADLVVGTGWVRDRRRRWTAEDSCAIIFATRHATAPGVGVRMIGPRGVRDLRFESTSNADFALFWERWNHPHPRPDLDPLEAPPGSGASD